MPVQIQCHAVVIRNDALDRVLEGGAKNFGSIAPNAMSYSDELLSQASFMSSIDAEEFARSLELRGLNREEESPDFVVVQSHNQEVDPPCDWLILFEYEKRLIATMRGSESRTVIASAQDAEYNPDAIRHYSAEEIAEHFEFVERQGAIDTYREKATGRLVYHTRQTQTSDEIFSAAFETIWNLHREPGRAARVGADAEEIQQAISALQSLASRHPQVAKVSLALGMAWFAVGKTDLAIRQLQRALELDPENTVVLKELGGVYLDSGNFAEAVDAATKAVAIKPDDAELLGNLAVSQLLHRQSSQAQVTLRHAISLDPNDAINRNLQKIIQDVVAGKRPQPMTLRELMTPHKPKSWLARFFGKGR
ncbi:MAG: tetratricopeptide repeat protein [Pirellulales bacterium]|nr:tetratricopeptide repeat protein [Pirellulales bacterium]